MSAFFIKSIQTYDRVWCTQNIIIATICGYALMVILRVIVYSPTQKYTPFVDNTTDIFSWRMDPLVTMFDAISEICLSIGTGTFCIICYFLAANQARKAGSLQVQYKKQELVLLRVGVVTFLTLLPTATRSILSLVAMTTNNDELYLFTGRASSMCIEVMFVFQPWMLLISCPPLRDKFLMTLGITLRASRISSNGSNSRGQHTVSIIT